MEIINEHRPSQVLVDLNAIAHNIHIVQEKMASHQQLFAVVKADGYGHGAFAIAETALDEGASGLAVATVDEAIALREAGLSCPILILGLTDPRGIAELLYYQLIITVSDLEFFKRAEEQLLATDQYNLLENNRLAFHLALDTGMGRIGLKSQDEINDFITGIQTFAWADWQGVFTHFSTIGGGPPEYVQMQWQRWQAWLKLIPETVRVRHFANSAMGLWGEEFQPSSDIVRYGISMYGIDPKDQLPGPQELKPALSFISEIVYVKQIKVGEKVSYGATYTAMEDEWIATIPVGYADGWLRHYHSIPILVSGFQCPVVGVINMDQLMIKLPKYFPVGTTVTLIGKNGQFENHVSQMAKELDTIGYEILTSIGKRIPRFYIKEETDHGSLSN